jgi:hypothetical protein
LRGGEECLGRAARRAVDTSLAESVEFWWSRYQGLPWLRLRARREALRSYRRVVLDAFTAGLEPRYVNAPPFASGVDRESALTTKTLALAAVSRELESVRDPVTRSALEARRDELVAKIADYRNPTPRRLAFPDPKAPPAAWASAG